MGKHANHPPPSTLIERLFDPSNGLIVFSLVVGLVYGVAPVIAYFFLPQNDAFLKLAAITLCSLAAMVIGSKISVFDCRFTSHTPHIFISVRHFIVFTWSVFLVFFVVAFATAPSIPILSAFQGASANELSQERGDFLKGRQGAGITLLYISTFLVNTIVPYSIILLYSFRSKFRHLSAMLFFLFCVSFLQKSLFLNLVLPLLAYFAISRKMRGKVLFGLISGSLALLVLTTFLSLSGEMSESENSGDYMSAQYIPANFLDYFLWRSTAVPIFTAADTLIVHAEQFGASPLLGATSSLLAAIFDVERVNIERFVFEHQFGSWNDTANANAVFVIDAYVNFDWFGVVAFGLFVGLVFRWFRISQDVAFRSLWVIFAFILFSSPLIGMLLSNGFLYMLFHALYIRVGTHGRRIS